MIEALYDRIDCTAWRNVWVVGDIHGNTDALMEMLDSAGFDFAQDLLVATGDLIDRGPDSLGALRLITLGWFRTVRGNHEQMAYDAVINDNGAMFRCWMDNGGLWFLNLDEVEELEATSLLRKVPGLPHILELRTETETIVVGHGDYPGTQYGYNRAVSAERVIWGRERIDALLAGKPRPLKGADRFFFGHTPVVTHSVADNLHYIDTGAGFGRAPTIYCIQEKQ